MASLMSVVPVADRTGCPAGGPSARMPAPAVWFEPELPWWMSDPPGTSPTPTSATHGIDITLPGSAWFPSYSGGSSNGARLLYDTVSGAYYVCAHHDTAIEFDAVEEPLAWVDRAVPARAAGIVLRTSHGITFGSSPQFVESIYGTAKSQPSFVDTLMYEKKQNLDSTTVFVTDTTFYFRNGRLFAMKRISGV
ncbi:MAG TPA: hypothetical protein VMG98_10235 [Verrucomicrobiae bacterium]|nr:hypothetical protein [Verrucomicrobiae bacterium]